MIYLHLFMNYIKINLYVMKNNGNNNYKMYKNLFKILNILKDQIKEVKIYKKNNLDNGYQINYLVIT